MNTRYVVERVTNTKINLKEKENGTLTGRNSSEIWNIIGGILW